MKDIVVAGLTDSRGQKSDTLDAFRRAEELRTGTVKISVFKAPPQFSRLRELARVHSMLVRDVVRVQLRVKAMYRSRGVAAVGTSVYGSRERKSWLSKLPLPSRWATERLHEEYDLLAPLKQVDERELLAEARKQPIAKILATVPGLGPIRVAQLLPIVVTPHRFRTRSEPIRRSNGTHDRHDRDRRNKVGGSIRVRTKPIDARWSPYG